jgi:DNA-binding NtrC family response regulator
MKKILFIDDEASILKTYRRMTQNYDYECFYAHNIDEAFDLFDTHQIDLIISDYRLQHETGLDFLKEIRKEDSKTPMVVISGFAEEQLVEEAMEKNIIQDYLVKPLSQKDFRKVLMTYLEAS